MTLRVLLAMATVAVLPIGCGDDAPGPGTDSGTGDAAVPDGATDAGEVADAADLDAPPPDAGPRCPDGQWWDGEGRRCSPCPAMSVDCVDLLSPTAPSIQRESGIVTIVVPASRLEVVTAVWSFELGWQEPMAAGTETLATTFAVADNVLTADLDEVSERAPSTWRTIDRSAIVLVDRCGTTTTIDELNAPGGLAFDLAGSRAVPRCTFE